MSLVLLKPFFYSFKNQVFARARKRMLNRDLVFLFVSIAMMVTIYAFVFAFLTKLQSHPFFEPLLLVNFVSGGLFAFFLLLMFSATIIALGAIFTSNDMPLLLAVPVTNAQIFLAKLCEVAVAAGWMFVLFGVPAGLAFAIALKLSPFFVVAGGALIVPFLLIPAAVGIALVCCLVNLIPPYRMRDLLVVIAFLTSIVLLNMSRTTNAYLPTEEEKMNRLVMFLSEFRDPQPWWLPSRWVSDVIGSFLIPQTQFPLASCVLLVTTSLGTVAFSYLVFDSLFIRGLTMAGQSSKGGKIHSSVVGTFLARALVPFDSQFRAMLFKEARMFIRDTTQALQLVLLLLLTFMYLYNFRALQMQTEVSAASSEWWQVILALANVSFGACVVSAIATRFVFPAVSLEGRAYNLLRTTPLTIPRLLRYKYLTWLVPMSGLSIVLLVSGAMAFHGTVGGLLATALCGLALSIGITGLGVGSGAVFAKFDWDSPTQVTASFGSLVFMMLSFVLILVSIVPAGFLFILVSVNGLTATMEPHSYLIANICSATLLLFVNIAAARRALIAGATALQDLERD